MPWADCPDQLLHRLTNYRVIYIVWQTTGWSCSTCLPSWSNYCQCQANQALDRYHQYLRNGFLEVSRKLQDLYLIRFVWKMVKLLDDILIIELVLRLQLIVDRLGIYQFKLTLYQIILKRTLTVRSYSNHKQWSGKLGNHTSRFQLNSKQRSCDSTISSQYQTSYITARINSSWKFKFNKCSSSRIYKSSGTPRQTQLLT